MNDQTNLAVKGGKSRSLGSALGLLALWVQIPGHMYLSYTYLEKKWPLQGRSVGTLRAYLVSHECSQPTLSKRQSPPSLDKEAKASKH